MSKQTSNMDKIDLIDKKLIKQIARGLEKLEAGKIPLLAIEYHDQRIIVLSDALEDVPMITLSKAKELFKLQDKAN